MQISIPLPINFHDSPRFFCGIKDNSFLYDRVKNYICNLTIKYRSRYFLQANHFHRLTRRIIFLRMRDCERLFLRRDVNEKKKKKYDEKINESINYKFVP